MPAAAWIALATMVGSGRAAWIAVRVVQARDSQRILALEQELVRLRDSFHDLRDHLNPLLTQIQLDIERLKK